MSYVLSFVYNEYFNPLNLDVPLETLDLICEVLGKKQISDEFKEKFDSYIHPLIDEINGVKRDNLWEQYISTISQTESIIRELKDMGFYEDFESSPYSDEVIIHLNYDGNDLDSLIKFSKEFLEKVENSYRFGGIELDTMMITDEEDDEILWAPKLDSSNKQVQEMNR